MSRTHFPLISLAALAVSLPLVSGCQPVASSYATGGPASAGAKPPAGPVYHLPVKTMSVSVGVNTLGLFVAIHDLRVEGDSEATYTLSYRPEGASADTFEVAIDPATGLLTSVKTEADSKLADVLNAAAKSAGQIAGAFEAGMVGQTHIFATRPLTYWPSATTEETSEQGAKRQIQELNTKINDLVVQVIETYGCKLHDVSVLAKERRAEFCDGDKARSDKIPKITLNIVYTPYKTADRAASKDCSIGICTRVEKMAQITLDAYGSTGFARVPLPNGSDPVALPLRRTPFTKVTSEYTLSEGLVTKASYEKGAEWVAIAALPGQLVGSVIGGLIDGVGQAGKLRKARADATGSGTAADAGSGSGATTADSSKSDAGKGTADAPGGQNEAGAGQTTPQDFDSKVLVMVYPLPNLLVATPPPAPPAHNPDGTTNLGGGAPKQAAAAPGKTKKTLPGGTH